jgi:hypothetical protein
MQKIFLLVIGCCAIVQLGHAQSAIKAGTVALSGSINFTQNKEETTSSSSSYGGPYTYTYTNKTFNFNPGLSYFVADNLAIGADAAWGIQEISIKSGGSANPSYRTTTSLRVGPFARYYHMLTDQFGFTGTLGAGYAHDSQPASTNSSSYDLKTNGFYAALTPGLIFLPIPRLGLGASIGGLSYNRLSVKPDNGSSTNSDDIISTFNANFGLAQLTFSGTYFFGR